MPAHDNFIGGTGKHGGGRHGQKRNDYTYVIVPGTQVVHEGFGRFRGSPGTVQDEIQLVAFEFAHRRREGLDVFYSECNKR